ncbi:zinc knuckle [Oesophagostomum dentatum]|uniref:Zinc knuckle n=1 Tax=Oesophagostomum dentatum TaxID=61180 RepID=A0A0B1TCZ0_OESDE|nr:zinc knuckle [Oesophagostomum dentatum]
MEEEDLNLEEITKEVDEMKRDLHGQGHSKPDEGKDARKQNGIAKVLQPEVWSDRRSITDSRHEEPAPIEDWYEHNSSPRSRDWGEQQEAQVATGQDAKKYGDIITDEDSLIEILGDDHLGGRAKNIFLSLPDYIKRQGFEAVVRELGNLVAGDSTAARMEALTELRNLHIKQGQSVSEFCLVLENLGRKANPDETIEDRSMEYSQILLENLRDWPEHAQLLGALYKVEPRQAYNKMKEMAIRIEQSRTMYGTINNTPRAQAKYGWRSRAKEYRKIFDPVEPVKPVSRAREDNPGMAIMRPPSKSEQQERDLQSGRNSPSREHVQHNTQEVGKRCFKCYRYGHMARNCPESMQVREGREREPTQDNRGEHKRSLSSLIQRVRTMGVRMRETVVSKGDLFGKPTVGKIELLNQKSWALLDSGSMISIISSKVLADAHKKGFDIDTLELVERDPSETVYDASRNQMSFLAIVQIPASLEGGKTKTVAFHISEKEEDEVLLGTNALEKLGVNITISCNENGETHVLKTEKNHVRAASRAIIPPLGCRVVPAACETLELTQERLSRSPRCMHRRGRRHPGEEGCGKRKTTGATYHRRDHIDLSV